MAKIDTIYVNANGVARLKPVKLIKGELRILTVDCTAYCGAKSASVNSVVVEAEDSVVTVASASVSADVATFEVAANMEGKTTIKVSATLDSGEILVRKFLATVCDPMIGSTSDYAS